MQTPRNAKLIQSEVEIPIQDFLLKGILQIPNDANSIVVFAHGSGSGRFSTRNQHVANILNNANIATLLFDLLTEKEEQLDEWSREYRFDIPLLSSRLVSVTKWLLETSNTRHLSIGYFGASTGAGAALVASTKMENKVKAIVSRGGRPDLAGSRLSVVTAPTLLIVGGEDTVVIEMNQNAMKEMPCIKKLEIVAGATHLFEEPGTLDEAARLAKEWFIKYL